MFLIFRALSILKDDICISQLFYICLEKRLREEVKRAESNGRSDKNGKRKAKKPTTMNKLSA